MSKTKKMKRDNSEEFWENLSDEDTTNIAANFILKGFWNSEFNEFNKYNMLDCFNDNDYVSRESSIRNFLCKMVREGYATKERRIERDIDGVFTFMSYTKQKNYNKFVKKERIFRKK